MRRYRRVRARARADRSDGQPVRARARAARWRGIGVRRRCAISIASRPATSTTMRCEWQARAALWAAIGDWLANIDRRDVRHAARRSRAGATGRRARPTQRRSEARATAVRVGADRRQLLLDHGRGAARINRWRRIRRSWSSTRCSSKQIEQLPALVRARELLPQRPARSRGPANGRTASRCCRRRRDRRPFISPRAGVGTTRRSPTATQQRVFNDYELLYPQPFDREVRTAAQLSEPAARADLQRDAPGKPVSRATRFPRPARAACCRCCRRPRVARRAHGSGRDRRPTICSIRTSTCPLGAAHLRELIDRFGGQTIVALAGYNAGPNAAARWLPPQSVDADVWIENIPYNETRTYVQRILWHNVVFTWLQDRRAAEGDTGWRDRAAGVRLSAGQNRSQAEA